MLSENTFHLQQGSASTEGNWMAADGMLSLCPKDEDEMICEVFIIDENTEETLMLSTINNNNSCRTTVTYQQEEALNAN